MGNYITAIARGMPVEEDENGRYGKLPQKQYSLKIDKMFNFKTVKDEKKHI